MVREYLFAITDNRAVINNIKTTFSTTADVDIDHPCEICKGTSPLKFSTLGVVYIEAMTTKATATNIHTIWDTNDVGTFINPYSLLDSTF